MKQKLLNIPKDVIEKHSSTSRCVSYEMAIAARFKFGASISIGVTGDIEDPYVVYYTIVHNQYYFTDEITIQHKTLNREKRKMEVVEHILVSLLVIIRSMNI